MSAETEKVEMPRYVTVEGVAYVRADISHDLQEALEDLTAVVKQAGGYTPSRAYSAFDLPLAAAKAAIAKATA